MEGILFFLLITAISAVANIVSQLAGGGTSLIVIPSLVFLGIDPRVTIASIKMSSVGGITALPTYIKSNKIVWTYVPFFIASGVFSAILGAFVLLSLDSEVVRRTIGFLILLLLPLMIFKKKWGLSHDVAVSTWKKRTGLAVYTGIAVLQSAFASGMGLFATYTLVTFFGYSLIHANATRRIALIVQNVTVFIVLLVGGLVNLWIGAGLLTGSLIGNHLGARLAVYKGNSFVKVFFVILIIVSGIKLIV